MNGCLLLEWTRNLGAVAGQVGSDGQAGLLQLCSISMDFFLMRELCATATDV
jgi:hypothetical protein